MSTAAPTHSAAPLVAAPKGYGDLPVGKVPLYPTGYADVLTWVPNGTYVSRAQTGTGWRTGTGTTDFRDESGRLLVRFTYQPATGSTDDQSLAKVIDGYRGLTGAHVTVTSPPHAGRLSLRQAEWTVDVPVGGAPRHALVSAWVLDRQVISIYASAPRDSAAAAAALYAHAVQLTIVRHAGEDGDY